MRLALARVCWSLADRFLSLGYRLAHGMSYRDYIASTAGRVE